MRKIFALLGFVFVLQASAQTLVRQMEGVSEYRLENGMQVLLAPNDLQPRVYANLIIKAGSAVEGLGEGGMAHLLEHLVFKGTPTTKDPMSEFSKRSFSSNGTTDLDRTNYFASMNANKENLYWFIGWLADAMSNSFIAKAGLDKEMPVVRNEFERGASSVGRGMADARMALTFPNHGYGRPVIGNQSDIENVNIEKLQAFYKTWYRPDNAVLVVSGRFEVGETLIHIQSVFGILTNPAAPMPKLYTREPVQTGSKSMTIRRAGGEPQLLMSWRGTPSAHFDDAVLDVIAHALTNGADGRFSKSVTAQNLGAQHYGSHRAYAQYGWFNVGLQLQEVGKASVAMSTVQKHINDIAASGVTQEELRRAKNLFLANKEDVKNTAESFGSALAGSVSTGDWRLLFWHRDNLAKVTIEETKRAAASYLIPANQVVVTYIPEEKPARAPEALAVALGDYVAAPKAVAANPMPERPAALLERFEASPDELDKRTVKSVLPVGTKLALLARPAVGDAIQGTLRLHWGNLEDYKKWGINVSVAANFGALLMRGTVTRNNKELDDELNRLQSSLRISSGLWGLTATFKTTRSNWSAFAKLMTQVLREPGFMSDAFPASQFAVWKDTIVAPINNNKDAPATLAENAISRTFWRYPQDDPRYIRTPAESLQAWRNVRIEDVRRFWREFAGASTSEFAAAGALDAAQVQIDVAHMLDGWVSPKPFVRIPYAMPTWTAGTQVIQTPDKANASLLARRYFADETYSKESIALQVANGIIGATSGSRLFSKLRKEEGLTYGTYSGFNSDQDNQFANFGINGTFAPQNRGRFEQVLEEAKQDIIKNGLWRLELAAAKNVALERAKANRENDASVAGTLAFNEYRGRNYAFWQAQLELTQSLTIEDIDAAAKKLLDAKDFVTIVTGDFK
jgi:zinc protease